MADWKASLYRQLPPLLRDVAASARGLHLRHWRYGPETDQLVEDALERDFWPAEKWQIYRENRLAYILHRAATSVPYYREQWQNRRRNGDKASWNYLENWPVLEKEKLRVAPRTFVADDYDVRRLFLLHTSGTTGKALDLWWSREMLRGWYALFEARWRRWNGVTRHDNWAILGGQLVTPVTQQHPPFWVWNAALNQLYMSSYHLSPNLIQFYVGALSKYRIKYLWGYTSALYELALGVLRGGKADFQLTVVIANAEPVEPYQREKIESAFQCPLRETYGMAEAVACASECEAGTLHAWPEVGWTEVMSEGGIQTNVMSGDLVSTGLLSEHMPLIRYRVGDSGVLDGETQVCSCGRLLPRFGSIEGRSDDILYSHDGRRIGRLDPVFKARLPVKEAQIIQEALGRFVVRYVPAEGFNSGAAESIKERLIDRVGPAEVIFEPVGHIPREPNGKFRSVINKMR